MRTLQAFPMLGSESGSSALSCTPDCVQSGTAGALLTSWAVYEEEDCSCRMLGPLTADSPEATKCWFYFMRDGTLEGQACAEDTWVFQRVRVAPAAVQNLGSLTPPPSRALPRLGKPRPSHSIAFCTTNSPHLFHPPGAGTSLQSSTLVHFCTRRLSAPVVLFAPFLAFSLQPLQPSVSAACVEPLSYPHPVQPRFVLHATTPPSTYRHLYPLI
ncbi:hypothetical protein M011DRAFT_12286 [Sporormia fimetaria CBS 119925]|uniref:Uncharacterized protein n=1 Tax=Sporormia fimetaria CBS 119925 TaxID=1340428 RepID=A0A6A6VRY1_9PLEO|nr:hypothetical protein M011DRAFT_12286 [Sporormia fimetaria CBS 119925]